MNLFLETLELLDEPVPQVLLSHTALQSSLLRVMGVNMELPLRAREELPLTRMPGRNLGYQLVVGSQVSQLLPSQSVVDDGASSEGP